MTARIGDVIEKAARALYLSDRSDTQRDEFAARMWDEGEADGPVRDDYLRRARALAAEGLLAARPVTREYIAQVLTTTGFPDGRKFDYRDLPEQRQVAWLRRADVVLALLDQAPEQCETRLSDHQI